MDNLTGRPNHIEDYLVQLHPHQWFTWTNSKDKIYENLRLTSEYWLEGKAVSNPHSLPTKQECIDGFAELHAAYPLLQLRWKRNRLLASSDWTGLSDSALTSEVSAKWKLYRQKLRDLPSGLDTEEKVKNVTWPAKPE